MFGDSIGELQVIISIVGSNQIIFKKSNSQGNYWHYKELYFLPANNFQIIFNGIDGIGYKGDIALDHILLFSGNCNNYTISLDEPPVAGAVTVEEALTLAQLISVIAGILGSGVVTSAVVGICECWGCERGNKKSDYCCMWHCKCKKPEKVSCWQKQTGGSTISDDKIQQPNKESGEFDNIKIQTNIVVPSGKKPKGGSTITDNIKIQTNIVVPSGKKPKGGSTITEKGEGLVPLKRAEFILTDEYLLIIL
ncbi:uncharacterized protein [Mytilus edulis]|uniref:uncharacterized protein n=1 Tax=Mytilus edulis TaxID=6550 RepID=UPI0039F0302B